MQRRDMTHTHPRTDACRAWASRFTSRAPRSEGLKGTELLGQAVAAFSSALEVFTRDQLPQDWARKAPLPHQPVEDDCLNRLLSRRFEVLSKIEAGSMITENKNGNMSCRTVRAAKEFTGKQALLYAPAISADSVGAQNIHLQTVRPN